MLAQYRPYRRKNKAVAYVLAITMLSVLGTLGAALAVRAGTMIHMSGNARKVFQARLAADSGLDLAVLQMKDVLSEATWTTEIDMLDMVYSHLADRLNGTGNMVGRSVAYLPNAPGGARVDVPQISLPDDGTTFSFAITNAGEGLITLTVTGYAGEIKRSLAVNYALQVDTRILSYAVGSRPRIIARGNVQIDGDICTTWTRVDAAPGLDINLGDDGYVEGNIKTVLASDEFYMANGQDYIENTELHDKLQFDEPPIAGYTTEDFDTTELREKSTSSLPTCDYKKYEGYPETKPSRYFNRYFYVGSDSAPKVMTNVKISAGKNPHFINVVFKGYTYIDHPNNVVFENCTFEGPVITSVPDNFKWSTNSLYYKGNTIISNDVMPESTILAPNFNVNIGDFDKGGVQSNSVITGILVGGIVDLRDNVTVEGTILSMADLDNISDSSVKYYGTNLGYWEGDAEEGGGEVPMTTNIRVTPQPDNLLPLGMRTRFTVAIEPDSYEEVNP